MKDPYELRVIADALERWCEGPAVNAMRYAVTVLREIADEIDIMKTPVQVQVEQPAIPSSPVLESEVAENPMLAPTVESPSTASATTSPATDTSAVPVSALSAETPISGASENPTQAAKASPAISTSAPAASSPAPDTDASAPLTESPAA